MKLPYFHTDVAALALLQNKWSALINPLLNSPLANGLILEGVVLASGDNTINHTLGRPLQGWFAVRMNAAANLYDKQSTNQHTDLTLVLNSSAAVTVNLFVF